MQMNALLRKVHHHVALVNNEANHKLNIKLNQLVYKDPIQVGEKVLLPHPQSTITHLCHLNWIWIFKVSKTSGMIIHVRNENGETCTVVIRVVIMSSVVKILILKVCIVSTRLQYRFVSEHNLPLFIYAIVIADWPIFCCYCRASL